MCQKYKFSTDIFSIAKHSDWAFQNFTLRQAIYAVFQFISMDAQRTSDGSFLNDLFILNESLMWLGKNESSRGVIRSVAHAQHPIGSVLELVHLFWVFGFFQSRSFITWLMQYEPERELISSSSESLGLSRTFIMWQPHKLNLCSPYKSKDELIYSLSGSDCFG